jgi:hypothetical protein
MDSRDRITGPDAISACRRTAEATLGKVIEQVRYARPTFGGGEYPWDFGGWHRPILGVQLDLAGNGPVHAIWSERATHFHLQFGLGALEEEWTSMRDDPAAARVWDVTGHPAWRPIIGAPIVAVSLALGRPDDPPVQAPVAVKLYSNLGSVWLVAAAPREPPSASAYLNAEDVWVGHDEVMVVFDDAIAERIGLIEAVSIGSPPKPTS